MSTPDRSPQAFRVSDLAGREEHAFELQPDAEARHALAEQLQIAALRKLVFRGVLRAVGQGDWQLQADLGATVTQPCSITLDPVTTRIDTKVTRLYQHDYVEVDATEVEMPEDDTIEPLGRFIDPEAVMEEALALALPLYPRRDDAALGQVVYTEPGKEPMRDEDTRPFADLAAFRKKLAGKDDQSGND